MPKMIFVNLPVADVAASTAFYEAIGFRKNAQFSNEQGAAMIWSDAIYVMLLAKPFFATFTDKTIVDAATSTTGHYALSFDSREEVDAITQAAVEAGGSELHEPQDMGFMYSRAFQDLDGHGFGPFWMAPAAVDGGPPDGA
ncbi:VOC family protein [Sphingomonas sanguinis]|uniref:VOC family protein n=1 Tax=Sphingomonas sanguinis TaxID=33051 RepID=A0ABU5LM08_9SPHN|nr:VOC family protein [Sphingomonas sanguinis]MDZ7280776.1 VOC family protein [Sphingomonas sanguinis]QXT36001.1 VOC family protein [Sphingomonas sanguinis]